jgi:hypothetical protein
MNGICVWRLVGWYWYMSGGWWDDTDMCMEVGGMILIQDHRKANLPMANSARTGQESSSDSAVWGRLSRKDYLGEESPIWSPLGQKRGLNDGRLAIQVLKCVCFINILCLIARLYNKIFFIFVFSMLLISVMDITYWTSYYRHQKCLVYTKNKRLCHTVT